jgi:hypothetical protein
LKFHANGTGTAQFKEVIIVHPPAVPSSSASSTEYSLSFTYAVADDGTLTIETVSGSTSGTVLTGPSINYTFIVLDGPPVSGRIARDNTVITLTSTDPTAETLLLTTPTGVSITRPRICHRTRVIFPVVWGEHDKD